MKLNFLSLFASLYIAASVLPNGAQALEEKGQETGFPLPRFVSLKSEKANMRVGPGLQYRIKLVYTEPGFPLEVLAEYGNWRQVRDYSADVGWMHEVLLSGKRTAVVAPWKKGYTALRERPSFDGNVRAKLESKVLVNVNSCNTAWCNVSAGDPSVEGYVNQLALWGVYPGEAIN